MVDLTVPEDASPVERPRKSGAPLQGFGAGDEPGARNAASGIGKTVVAVEGERVQQGEGRGQDFLPAHAVSLRGDHDRQRLYHVGRDPEQRPALPARLTNPDDVEMLEIADSAVHDLEGVGRRRPTEVPPLEQGHREAALRRVPGDRGAADAASNDHDIERLGCEGGEIPIHACSGSMSNPPASWRTACRDRRPCRSPRSWLVRTPRGGKDARKWLDSRCGAHPTTGGLPNGRRRDHHTATWDPGLQAPKT